MRFRGTCLLTLLLTLLLALARRGDADVITFGTDDIDHLNQAGVQTEGAFRYQATIGAGWELIIIEGNPPAALATFWDDESASVGDTVDITAVGNAQFTFQSVDFRTVLASNSDDVTLTGFLSGVPAGTLSLTASAVTFQTVPSGFGGPIDLLRVRVVGHDLGGADLANAMILDNVNLTIPEPAAALPGMIALAVARLAARHRGR